MVAIDAETAYMIPRLRLLAAAVMVFAIHNRGTSGQDSRPTVGPATHVRPIGLAALHKRIDALPEEERAMIRLYMQAVRREVLKPEDSEIIVPSVPDHPDDSGKVHVPARSVLCWRKGGPRLF